MVESKKCSDLPFDHSDQGTILRDKEKFVHPYDIVVGIHENLVKLCDERPPHTIHEDHFPHIIHRFVIWSLRSNGPPELFL